VRQRAPMLHLTTQYSSGYFRRSSVWLSYGNNCSRMKRGNEKKTIELGMKVSVRRSTQNHIGIVTRVEGDYVFVRWLNSDLGETAEYQAHRDDVTPLAGWL
jgi:hypothetical protein